jgi:hypothetical protein
MLRTTDAPGLGALGAGEERPSAVPEASTVYTEPLNETKIHRLPARTAFSVTGSRSGSKKAAVRALPISFPDSSIVITSAEPSPQRLKKRRAPAAYTRLQPGISISPTNLRCSTSTMLSEVRGVQLNSATKAPCASATASVARLPGTCTSSRNDSVAVS